MLNLAAGLEQPVARYRANLPPDFTWVEADLPELLAEKEPGSSAYARPDYFGAVSSSAMLSGSRNSRM